MPEETPKPAGGGEKSPIFQAATGAIDRAGASATGGTGSEGGGEKKIDKVLEEALKYYDQKYEEALKEIDPAFDPKIPESTLVKELTKDSNAYDIRDSLQEGKALDGVKDIVPLAENAAENKVNLVNELKSGSVTSIAERVGYKGIKESENYKEVSGEFDKNIKDEKSKFDTALNKFWDSYLRIMNSDNMMLTEGLVKKLYTPENNAIISALAKILEKKGFTSESVKIMSKRFEENLKKYLDSKNPDEVMPFPGATGAAGTTGATGATGAKSEQKLEKKLEQKGATGAGTTGAGAANVTGAATPVTEPGKAGEPKPDDKKTTEPGKEPKKETTKTEIADKKPVEGAKENVTAKSTETKTEPPKMDQAKDLFKSLGFDSSGGSDKKETKESSKQELTSKEGAGTKEGAKEGDKKEEGKSGEPTTEKGEQKIEESKGKDSRVDFIKSIFGGLLGKEGGSLESSKEDLKKEAGKTVESKMESTKSQVSEKIEKKAETIPGGGAIKETTSQKLATPSAAASTKTENATKSESPSESSTSTTPQEATSASSVAGGSTGEAKGATGEGKGEGGGGLEGKMDSMIALLSQLNSTLQGPLLTINSSKKFD